jgi:hypothetical protein
MAILEASQSQISGGFEKKIEDSAVGMILDMVQKSQYQYPLKSSVREIVSNALDSIRERDAALLILNGQAKVADFYEQREGELYSDSKFDVNYYDPKWLSKDPKVYITYLEGRNMEKDKLIISDNGVGLGLYRLEKYFSIGYSTKRLMKLPLGKFGVGNKAPLSLNPFYTMESRYNGRKFRFNIYSGKVESIIPRFDLEKNTENKRFVLPNGYELFYEDTTELNGVSIIMEAKKHYKTQIEEAVESQLLYFDNIEFKIDHAEIPIEIVDFKANILYEDDFIVLSDSEYYSKPHILLNKVNYGYIDFDELELEQKIGNIGIKVQPEDVEVHPSRERLVWDEKTKEMITTRFKQVVDIATNLIQGELQETDFLRWVRLCYNIAARYSQQDSRSNGSVVERLSLLIDMSKVEPYYNGTKIRFNSDLFEFLQMKVVNLVESKRANKSGMKVERKLVKTLMNSAKLPIVLSTGRSNNRKDKYLLSQYSNGFIRIKPPLWMSEEAQEWSHEELIDKLLTDESRTDWGREKMKKRLDNNIAETIWDLLKHSSGVLDYEAVDVPDSFTGSNEEEDLVEDEQTKDEEKASKMSAEERRKLEGKVVLFTPRWADYTHADFIFDWQKLEAPVKEIGDWDEEEIYYGNDADKDTLQFVTFLTRDTRNESHLFCRGQNNVNPQQRLGNADSSYAPYSQNESVTGYQAYRCTHFFENKPIKIIKVSQNTTKLYRDFYHINKFFYRLNKGVLTMSNILIKWNTARQLKKELHKLNFLWNYPFDSAKQAKFKEFVQYVKDNFRETSGFEDKGVSNELTDKLVSHLDKVQQFQMFVQSNQNPEEIARLALEMWKTDKVTDSCAIDMTVWNEFKALVDWAEPLGVMLNEMPVLTGIKTVALGITNQYQTREDFTLPTEGLERAIISYVKSKDVS